MTRPDAAEVAAMLAYRMPQLTTELCGTPTGRAGATWRYGRHGSLAVVIAGAKQGSWHDHEAGQGGDALALVARQRGGSMGDAWQWALAWLGIGDGTNTPAAPRRPPPAARAPQDASSTISLARTIWTEAWPASGTLAEIYLTARGVALPQSAPIRFHPSCPRGPDRLPAMVALMTAPETGEPVGVHRTFLQDDGQDRLRDAKGRAMAGRAGIIRLAPDAEVTAGLGLAEGLETGLSVMQHFGWSPVWAATSAGAIARFPVLPGIEALTVFADADDAGTASARACCEAWTEAGRETRVCRPSRGDFNDMIRARAA